MLLIRTTLSENEQWECENCGYPMGPGETALTTDPEELPNVYCGTECAKIRLGETNLTVQMEKQIARP